MRSVPSPKDVTLRHSQITGLALRSPKGEGGSRVTGKLLNYGNFRYTCHDFQQLHHRAASLRHIKAE